MIGFCSDIDIGFAIISVDQKRALLCSLVAVSVQLVNAQDDSDYPVSSWPHAYPGMPSGDFSPEWQDCTFHRLLFSQYAKDDFSQTALHI